MKKSDKKPRKSTTTTMMNEADFIAMLSVEDLEKHEGHIEAKRREQAVRGQPERPHMIQG